MESRKILLRATRPGIQGLEQHLAGLRDGVLAAKSSLVFVDPITNLVSVGSNYEVKAMLTRLVDQLRKAEVTVVMTSLIMGPGRSHSAEIGISSLMDAVVLLENRETGNRRRCRTISVRKSRGLPSSQDVCELGLSQSGIAVREPRRDGESSP